MPFDGLTATYFTNELQNLIGSKVDKVHQPHKETLLLHLRTQTGNQKLLISSHAVNARLHITTKSYVNPLQPALFCMVLRKHLEGTRLKEIIQEPMERSLRFVFAGSDEIGRPTEKYLYVEIMGKYSNIVLTMPDGTILDGIRRYSHEVSRHREILPGETYIAPPVQDKVNPVLLSESAFSTALFGALSAKKLANSLTDVFLGLSLPAAREILARADIPEDTRGEVVGEYELIRIWQAWNDIKPGNILKPTVVKIAGLETDFFPYNPVHLESEQTNFVTLSEAADFFYSAKESNLIFASRKAELLKTLRIFSEKAAKKSALQEEDLLQAEDATKYRIYGELLTANFWQLPERAEEVTLENFYDGKQMTIPLDKQFSIAINAQKFFKKHAKAKQTLIYLTEQKLETKHEQDYLEQVETVTELTENLLDFDEITKELELGGYLKPKRIKGKKQKEQPMSDPLLFSSPDGFNVYVGRNNLQNDKLTLKFARNNDIWLHTKDIPGAHVIIKSEGKPVPETTLYFAAQCAARHSKARYGNQVPVDYTEVKNIKKPNGAKPGYVIYDKQKTVYVTP